MERYKITSYLKRLSYCYENIDKGILGVYLKGDLRHKYILSNGSKFRSDNELMFFKQDFVENFYGFGYFYDVPNHHLFDVISKAIARGNVSAKAAEELGDLIRSKFNCTSVDKKTCIKE